LRIDARPGAARSVCFSHARSRRGRNVDAVYTLVALLCALGYEARAAYNGEDGFVAVETFAPDVAIVDLGMPGMSGYDLATRLRVDSRFAQLPLIALTAYSQERHRVRAASAGYNHHLVKPALIEDVLLILARYDIIDGR
jgi:CheY-like chemotaxis protein